MKSSINSTTLPNTQTSYSNLPSIHSTIQQTNPVQVVENRSNVAAVPMVSASPYPVPALPVGGVNNHTVAYGSNDNNNAQPEYLPNMSMSGNKRPLLPDSTTVGSTDLNNNNNSINQNCPIKPQTEPLAPLNREGRNLSEKKLRRLEKNRISARECRRKKREAAQNLEREINILEGENLELRLKLQIGDQAEKTSQKEQKRLIEELNSMMNSGASESEIYATIEEFKERCADYGRDRRSAIEFHLRHVERLLMPTTTTTVAMSALRGTTGTNAPDSNIDNKTDQEGNTEEHLPKSLFHFLVKYLEVTPEQGAALKDSRSVSKELDSTLAESVTMLHELRRRLSECGEDMESEFANVRSILCPSQAAKFLVWVENNSACMHMLNELWNKVYPKPIVQPRGGQSDETIQTTNNGVIEQSKGDANSPSQEEN